MSSHKHLKGIVYNFGHSFVSLMNYISDDYFMEIIVSQEPQLF